MTTTPNPQDDGGPAFPCDPFIASEPGHQSVAKRLAEGMSLRDYFAAKALANAYTQCEADPDKGAEWAYQLADAMLRARSKEQA